LCQFYLLCKQVVIILVLATELVVKEEFAHVTTIGDLDCPIFRVIALKESALMILLGLTLPASWEIITSTRNAQTEASATVIVENVTAFLAMRAEDVKELLAQMIALATAVAYLFKIYPMLPSPTITRKETF